MSAALPSHQRLPSSLSLLVLWLLAACAPTWVELEVDPGDLPCTAPNEYRFRVTLARVEDSAMTAPVPQSFRIACPGPLKDTGHLELGMSITQIGDPLRLQVDAQDARLPECLVATGSDTQTLAPDSTRFVVRLKASPDACKLRFSTGGSVSGAKTLKLPSGEEVPGDPWGARFSPATPLTFHVQPESGARFSHWVVDEPPPCSVDPSASAPPACPGQGDCTAKPHNNRRLSVIAQLIPAPICDQSGSRFCWDNPRWGQHINAVWGFSAQDLWAVGSSGLILRWNGATWRQPSVATTYDLKALWAAAPDDLWIAGDGGQIYHGDGVSWTKHFPGTTKDLRALWGRGPNEVWAAGAGGALLRYRDGGWETIAGVGGADIHALWGSGGGDLWVGGDDGLRRWDAAAGKLVNVPLSPPRAITKLFGLAANDLWLGAADGALLRGDGQTFVAMPAGESVGAISALFALDATHAWAASESGPPLRWDGASWQPQDAPTAVRGEAVIRALWGSAPSALWALGDLGVALRGDGLGWRADAVFTGETLNAVAGTAPDDVWAVGYGGTLLHWNGARWRAIDSHTQRPLSAVHAFNRCEVWVAGASGTLLRVSGEDSVQAMDIGGTEDLLALWGSSSSDVWAAGYDGALLHFTGGRWQRHDQTKLDLKGIWGSGSNDVYFIGGDANQRLVLRYRDGAFTSQLLPGSGALFGVGGNSGSDVWVSGHPASLYHSDGVRFWPVSVAVNPTTALVRIFGSDSDHRFVLGRGPFEGVFLLQLSGETTVRIDLPQGALFGGYAFDPDNIWLVGERGSVLRWRP